MTRQRLLCCSHGYISMVGRAGRRKTRQCPIRLVRLTLPGSTTREISLSGGGLNTHLSEVALWLQSSPLTAIYSIY
ncbi:hypothetical protein FA041_02825 [Escherichia coli]|nr:hypothetical protein [Escherichia coli]